jgi:hypothetical protein
MRTVSVLLLAATLALASADASPQRRGGRSGFYHPNLPANPHYDGGFMFCRIWFDNAPNGDGNGWFVDYPRADINLSFRFSELTSAAVSRDGEGELNHAVYHLTDPEIFHCPFMMMTEPGGAYFSDEEAKHLHDYLVRGGFLWADDFWGEYAWTHWDNEIRKALPAEEFPSPTWRWIIRSFMSSMTFGSCRKSRRSTSGWAPAAARRSAAPTAQCRMHAPSAIRRDTCSSS